MSKSTIMIVMILSMVEDMGSEQPSTIPMHLPNTAALKHAPCTF